MAIGGKTLGQRRLARQLLAARQFPADDIETDVVGDAAPQGDAPQIGSLGGLQLCHCKFMHPA
jgi:hypothetical protein